MVWTLRKYWPWSCHNVPALGAETCRQFVAWLELRASRVEDLKLDLDFRCDVLDSARIMYAVISIVIAITAFIIHRLQMLLLPHAIFAAMSGMRTCLLRGCA